MANTQWRVNAFSFVGLDYPAIFEIAAIYGVDITPAIFQKLKILEMHELARQGKGEEHGSGNSNRN